MRVLGVDCGDVILNVWSGPIPDAMDSLRAIVQSGRFEKVYIVSKAHPITRIIYLAWLSHLDFWNYTGIARRDLYFCLRHKDKAPICEKLGITHFVDDRFEVLSHLKTVPYRYALAPTKPHPFKDAIVVHSWKELLPLLLSS